MITVKYYPVPIRMQLHFCQMYFYSSITGLCWEQFYFFLHKNRDVLRCWLVRSDSPSVPKYSPSAFSAGTENRLKTCRESWTERRSIAYIQSSHPDTNWPVVVRKEVSPAKRSQGDGLLQKITHPPAMGTAPDGQTAAKHTSAHQPVSKLICQASPNNFCVLKHITVG